MIYDAWTNFLDNMSEVTDITDSFFWNKPLWSELLLRILRQNPQSVGVTLYFGDNIGTVRMTPEDQRIFLDPRIVGFDHQFSGTHPDPGLYQPRPQQSGQQ